MMVKWIVILGVLLLIGGIGYFLLGSSYDHLSGRSELAACSDRVVTKFAKKVAPKSLHACGVGCRELHGQIIHIEVAFQYGVVLDIPAARRLIVDLVLSFLDVINHDEPVQKFLYHTPFTPEDVIINIWPNHSKLSEEECSKSVWISANLGNMRYRINDGTVYPLHKLLEETFAEAQQRLQEGSSGSTL